MKAIKQLLTGVLLFFALLVMLDASAGAARETAEEEAAPEHVMLCASETENKEIQLTLR